MSGKSCVHQHHNLPAHIFATCCLLYPPCCMLVDRKIHHPHGTYSQAFSFLQFAAISKPTISMSITHLLFSLNVLPLWNPQITDFNSLWFIALFCSIFATGILEMRWSGVGIDEWWRNEQFWVIGGVSAHLFALFQGLLKVCAGIDTNFTVTSKSSEDENFGELYTFKWTSLLIPPTTLIIINLVGVVAGISDAINNGYQSWGPLFGKLFFAFWVIVHLYPFLKGLMGRQNRTPTIIIVWSILLASIFSLLWVRIDPFLPKQNGPNLVQCGLTCTWAYSFSVFLL